MSDGLKPQKSKSRQRGDKSYFQYKITLPIWALKETKWDENTELELKVIDGKIIISKIEDQE